jgi:cytochrome b6-f complex iron-sulfur subunit
MKELCMETNNPIVNGESLSSNQQTRREFCVCLCKTGSLLALSASLGQLFTACSENPVDQNGGGSSTPLPTIQGTRNGGTVTVDIPSDSHLATVGNAATVQYGGGALLVARVSENSFTALTPICTHEQCTITGYSGGRYRCPCHGSQFNTSGQVVNGPATQSLRSFATEFSNDILTITGVS